MNAYSHPLAAEAEANLNIVEKFRVKSISPTPPAPRDFIDGFFLPRGKATVFALNHGEGKTTAMLNSIVSAAATGVWTLFGTREHGRPLKCAIITGEETEEDFMIKLAFDGNPQSYQMARTAIEAGNLIILCLDVIQEGKGSRDRIFGEDGDFTSIGRDIFGTLERMKMDVITIDTLRSCGSADYNQEITSSNTMSALNTAARKCKAAIILCCHVTKEGAKMKLDEKTDPAVITGAVRGSGQIISQARNMIVLMKAPDDMYKGITAEKGDVKYVAALKTAMNNPLTNKTFPMIRSRKGLTFTAFVDGKTLLDIDKMNEKFTFLGLREVLPKLIFAASISGSPFTMTGQFSPEKLCDSTLHKLLPVGSTPEMVATAIKSLLADHYVVQSKVTENGAPSRYDVFSGPYATASSEGVKVPATKGAPDTDLLRFAASDKAEVLGDILEYARNRGTLAEGVEDLCRLEPGDMRMPEVQTEEGHSEEKVQAPAPSDDWEVPTRDEDEIPGMDQMPSDDSWEQRDYADVEIPDMDVTLSFEDTSTPMPHTADIEQMTVTGKVDFDI